MSAIARYLDILMFVARSDGPVRVSDVATGTGTSRTTVYRTLESLHREGWLRAHGSPRRFSPSLRLAEIGIAVLRHNHIRDVLIPHAIDLARLTQHYCSIAFYEDGEVIHTDAVLHLSERVYTALAGARYPATTGASGKILLAYQPPEELDRVLARTITRFTDRTRTDPEEVRQDLKVCRARGYGLSDRELTDDTVGIAVPVFDAPGSAVAALAVNVLRPIEGDVAQLARQATSIAIRASMELGYRPHMAEVFP